MSRSLSKTIKYLFRTMTPEDYLFNMKDCSLTKKSHVKTLTPLDNANQGDLLVSDEIQLIGVPKGETKHKIPEMDIFKQMLILGERDLIFLQIDPSPYIARQRFISHKCALGQVEDYRLDGVHLIDPHKPITWEETVVNLLTMDMLNKNSLPKQIKYKDGFYAYSHPSIQQETKSKEITENFVTQISTQILDGRRTGYDLIDKVLYTGLMGRHRIMLGGMPETHYRMILGKAVSVEQMRDMFRLVVGKNKQLTIPLTLKEATQNFLPHIFLLPKDLYMTAMIKQSFQAAIQMLSFVGIEHWRPIQQYWVGPPHGINLTEATRIPEGFPGQTVEDLIQKQALLDVMLESRVWSRNYLSNPFPYIFEDITKVDKKELQNYKKLFIKYYRKYSEFKNRQVKLLESNIQKLELEHKMKDSVDFRSKLGAQQLSKLKSNLGQTPVLKHLKNKMSLKLDKSIKIKG